MTGNTQPCSILQVVFYTRKPAPEKSWSDESDWESVYETLKTLKEELKTYGVELKWFDDQDNKIEIKGFGDVLNSIRLRYPKSGFGNTCLGHVIGKSPERDLAADLRRGVNRIVFAPETIEPQGSDRVVCHNCGCGC